MTKLTINNSKECVNDLIEMQALSKIYKNNVKALHNINLVIGKGEFIFLVGASGAGKSTLMKLLYREELPTTGNLIINGKNVKKMKRKHVPALRRNLGIVFQDYRLLDNRTVFDNIAFAMRAIEAPRKLIKDKVPKILKMVELENRKNQLVSELSGGEKQRVGIARAIINQPSIVLADEPTGNLDPGTSREIMDILLEINIQGTTLIMATHDKDLVNFARRRVVELKDGAIIRDDARGAYSHEA